MPTIFDLQNWCKRYIENIVNSKRGRSNTKSNNETNKFRN